MTANDFDRFDSRNDPDLQEPPICRHRAGDPDCMCDEQTKPKQRRDPRKDMERCCDRVEEIIRSIRSDFEPQKGM